MEIKTKNKILWIFYDMNQNLFFNFQKIVFCIKYHLPTEWDKFCYFYFSLKFFFFFFFFFFFKLFIRYKDDRAFFSAL